MTDMFSGLRRALVIVLVCLTVTSCFDHSQVQVLDLIDYYYYPLLRVRAAAGELPKIERRHVSINGELGQALSFQRGESISFYFHCPQKTWLHFYLGIDSNADRQAGRFPEPISGKKKSTAIEITIETDSPQFYTENHAYKYTLDTFLQPWYRHTLNLGSFAGNPVKLTCTWSETARDEPWNVMIGALELHSRDKSAILWNQRVAPQPMTPSPIIDRGLNPGTNLVIMLIDALRSDSTGFGGNPVIKTPYGDFLSKRGITFSNTMSTSSWTRPSVATLFTGTSPSVHTVNSRNAVLNEKLPKIAELFQDQGFQTNGIIRNCNVSRDYAFHHGFHKYVYKDNDKKIARVGIKTLKANKSEKNFLYLHFGDTHAPYRPPDIYKKMYDRNFSGSIDGNPQSIYWLHEQGDLRNPEDVEQLRSMYFATITRTDSFVGLILKNLKKDGIWRNTSILLISDHGEEFFEHNMYTHGKNLYHEVLHVPFVMVLPHWSEKNRIYQEPVEIRDIFHTLVDMYQLELADREYYTDSLLPLIVTPSRQNIGVENQRLLVQYLNLDHYWGHSMTFGNMKLIEMKDQPLELYDLKNDEQEQTNIAPTNPCTAGYYQFLLHTALTTQLKHFETEFIEKQGYMPEIKELFELDNETIKNLKELGYVD